MDTAHADALVFFGATGDLAFKKIFPALQAMIKRGRLDVPGIGVALSETPDQIRARDSLETHWGPAEAEQRLAPTGGWLNPVVTG
jgi:glucose-6-phosphate 1-dehydrogenase